MSLKLCLYHVCFWAMLFLPECPRQGLLLCNITTAVEIDDMICCTVDGQTSVCVSYTGVSIGSTATYTTSDNFCIDNKVLTRSCTSDMMWEGMTPTAIRGLTFTYTVPLFNVQLFSFGASEAEWVEHCPHNSRSHSVCCWSMCCYCTGSVADSENNSWL